MLATTPRFRFTSDFDLHLAPEVVGQNPYEDSKRWGLIQINMIQITGKCINIRTLKERIQNLVKKHSAKVKELEGKSGIEILVSELDDLLQQIEDLMKEFQPSKKTILVTVPQKTSYLKGYEAREEASNSLSYLEDPVPTVAEEVEIEDINLNIDSPTPKGFESDTLTRKRSLAQSNILTPPTLKRRSNIKGGTLSYLEKKTEKQYELRLREIALEERKQTLNEQKFELEKNEREKRLEMDGH